MKRFKQIKSTVILVFITLIVPQLSWANQNDSSSQTNANDGFQPITSTQSVRDPFTPSSLMYEMVGMQSSNNGFGFIPSPQAMRVPPMRLRGFLKTDSDELVALLEIGGALGGGRTYIVRKGDEINIDPTQPRNAIRITGIDRLSITVETGMLGQIRILR